MTTTSLKLDYLPSTLPKDEAICIELVEGVPILKASKKVQDKIELLLEKQQKGSLTSDDEEELNQYEALDDYLSLLNRTIRNFCVQ